MIGTVKCVWGRLKPPCVGFYNSRHYVKYYSSVLGRLLKHEVWLWKLSCPVLTTNENEKVSSTDEKLWLTGESRLIESETIPLTFCCDFRKEKIYYKQISPHFSPSICISDQISYNSLSNSLILSNLRPICCMQAMGQFCVACEVKYFYIGWINKIMKPVYALLQCIGSINHKRKHSRKIILLDIMTVKRYDIFLVHCVLLSWIQTLLF